MTPEGKVKKEIKAYLDSIGAYHVWPVPTGYGSPMVDCYACINGKFYAIEVKAPGKKPTPKQSLVLLNVKKAFGRSLTAWSYLDVANVV
jgi:hypothetical protein